MNPVVDAVLASWPVEPGLIIALAVTAGVYLRGWRALRRRDEQRWHAGQPSAFLGGLAVIFLALASPIEPFSSFFLQVHMVQHLLLMMAAPPLIWLGDPLFPFLRGLPAVVRVYWAAPVLRSPLLRQLFRGLSHPALAGLLYVTAAWLWHVPALYGLALGSSGWHTAQHLTFLATGLLFWFAVVRPYPFRPRWSRWLLVPLLILADVQNTMLSALLTFSDHVLYRHYASMPRLDSSTALDDQATAGVMMWVFGSLAYLVPLFGIAVRSLFGEDVGKRKPSVNVPRLASRVSLPLATSPSIPSAGFDLLRVPIFGAFLRWRYARVCLQVPLLLLAGVMVYDGLTGPAEAPMNLAGVLPWVHWRGLLIFGLLVAGNVFCTACPFMLPRALARRFLPQPFAWPARLRHKWLALLLLVVFLWAYEAFALWDSPWLTAWIAIVYFVGALVVDGLFRGASFCKYVCPIGQFNFVQSLLSPLEVKARDPATCTSCRTNDCLRGNTTARGCELGLFVPRKSSNMDCTLCLDCVHACPHDNVGLIAGPPGASLWNDGTRSGVRRLSRRLDVAALVLVLVFGAFANAAGMVGPVVAWQEQFAALVGIRSPFVVTTAFYVVALVVLPLLAVGMAAQLSRRWGRLPTSALDAAKRYAFALLPLGFGMWLAHYSFHFLSSFGTAVPVAQRFAADCGAAWLGKPEWSAACCAPVAGWLLPVEILCLDMGLLLSLYAGYRLAMAQSSRMALALKALAPWALLMLLLFAAGVWIVFQPMQMRGALGG
jgi:cytochrome c oxidase assembly factor CtaG/ferredoxin